MTVNEILIDPEFGHLYLKVHSRATRYTFKAANDGGRGILITVPVGYKVADVLCAVEKMRPKLRELIGKQQETQQSHHIDWNFSIQSDCLHVSLIRGVGQRFQYRHEMGEFSFDDHQDLLVHRPARLILLCPSDCDFDAEGRQKWLYKVLVEGIRQHARDQLVNRMRAYADHFQIPLREIKVNASQSHWGSCSRHRQSSLLHNTSYYNINLSIFTLLLPVPVQKLILLHELTHTRHMDHSPAFHRDLNLWLDGQEALLEQQLKRYHTDLWSFVQSTGEE